jgi:predicted dehydrogenase
VGIVAGTQRRHQLNYMETVKRLRDGAIGDIVECRAYWNGGTIWVIAPQPDWTDMEWQLRNWNYFTWLSGDHIVEQHVHNLDVINWALQGHPEQCMGMGGRAVRNLGNIWDHFAVEFEYAKGVRVESLCRQINGCTDRIAERVVGTKGYADVDRGVIEGEKPFRYTGPDPDHYVQEMADLIASIRTGRPHERLHRPGLEVGLGDDRLEAGPDAAQVRLGRVPGGAGGGPGQDTIDLRFLMYDF